MFRRKFSETGVHSSHSESKVLMWTAKKTEQRRRKASVAASAPRQQEGGNAKQRRDAKRRTARHEHGSAAPATPPRGNPGGGGGQQPGTGQPPYRDTQERELLFADGHGQTFTYKSISKMQEYQNKSFEELRCEDYARGNKGSADPPAGLNLVVAPAKAQEVGAPEETAPAAAGELGAGTHAPLAASPEFPYGSRLVWAAMPHIQCPRRRRRLCPQRRLAHFWRPPALPPRVSGDCRGRAPRPLQDRGRLRADVDRGRFRVDVPLPT